MKYIVLIGDGMSDEPQEALGGKTPLEAAHTPNMDFIAKSGWCGWSENIPSGFPPGSDVACLSIFGYNPKKFYKGRGPLEAASLGIVLKNNESAFRCNLVTIENNHMKDFTAGHITTEEAKILMNDLQKSLGSKNFHFYPGKSYRHLLVANIDLENVETVPPHDITDREILPYLPKGENADQFLSLMEKSKDILKNNEINKKRIKEGKRAANMIWLWGGGKSIAFPTYQERFAINGAVISAVDLIRGIANLAGLEIIEVPGITGFVDTNYKGKAEYALRVLEKLDIVFVHVEAIDEASHMGDLKLKSKAIEDFDKLVVGTILEGLNKFDAWKTLLLPDHATFLGLKTHVGLSVPFAVCSSEKQKTDKIKFFNENAISLSKVKVKGYNLIKNIIK